MEIEELIQNIDSLVLPPQGLEEAQRSQLLAACERLSLKLESPVEATMRYCFSPIQTTVLRLAIDMGLFDTAAELRQEYGASVEQLSTASSAQPQFVFRILRVLVGMGLFKEVEAGKFTPASTAAVYRTQSPLAQAVIHMTAQIGIVSRLPDYFEEKGYCNPDDAYDGPFQYVFGTNQHRFEWIATKPKLQHAFNVAMGLARQNVPEPWFEYFPVEQKLQVNATSDPLLIDIGGGVGRDLIAFQQKHPKLSGRLILQEIRSVVESVENLPSGIDVMEHDMFKAQPVKGAKAYFLRNVIHDWPDKQSRVILKSIHEAMSSDSILLINESVMPDSSVPLYNAQIDINMMATFSALERTENQFRILLEESGFELVKVWSPQDPKAGAAELFEAVKKS